jgi:hypothetical protein
VISNKSWNPQFIRAESANLEIGQSNLETDLIFLSNASISPCLPLRFTSFTLRFWKGYIEKAEVWVYIRSTSSKVALSAELNSKNFIFPIQTKKSSKTIKGIRSQEYNKFTIINFNSIKILPKSKSITIIRKKLKKRYLDLNFNLFNFKI